MIDAYEDARAAGRWLRSHARDLGIDPRAIVAGGWSAGAVTATNLAYMPGQSEARRPAPRIAAALPIAGWFVDPANPDIPIPGPFARPDPGEPPAIVFHGTADQILPVGSPRDLCPLAHEVHIVCEYVGWAGDGHAVLDSRRREVVRRSVDFLAAHVLRPRGYLDPAPSPGTS
jgi:acetyl esterase/lipase